MTLNWCRSELARLTGGAGYALCEVQEQWKQVHTRINCSRIVAVLFRFMIVDRTLSLEDLLSRCLGIENKSKKSYFRSYFWCRLCFSFVFFITPSDFNKTSYLTSRLVKLVLSFRNDDNNDDSAKKNFLREVVRIRDLGGSYSRLSSLCGNDLGFLTGLLLHKSPPPFYFNLSDVMIEHNDSDESCCIVSALERRRWLSHSRMVLVGVTLAYSPCLKVPTLTFSVVHYDQQNNIIFIYSAQELSGVKKITPQQHQKLAKNHKVAIKLAELLFK